MLFRSTRKCAAQHCRPEKEKVEQTWRLEMMMLFILSVGRSAGAGTAWLFSAGRVGCECINIMRVYHGGIPSESSQYPSHISLLVRAAVLFNFNPLQIQLGRSVSSLMSLSHISHNAKSYLFAISARGAGKMLLHFPGTGRVAKIEEGKTRRGSERKRRRYKNNTTK